MFVVHFQHWEKKNSLLHFGVTSMPSYILVSLTDGRHWSCMFSRSVVKVTNQLSDLFCWGLHELITKVYIQRRTSKDYNDIIWVVWHNYPGWDVGSAAFCAVGRYHIKSDKQNIIIWLRNKTVNRLDLYKLGEFLIYEFLSGVARCAGYELLQN